MGNTRDQVGKAGLFVAGGIFRTAFYVCVAVLIFWIGKSASSVFSEKTRIRYKIFSFCWKDFGISLLLFICQYCYDSRI